MVLNLAAAPALTAFLKSDRNIGALLIVTGEDGVKVFLNGKEYRRATQKGQLRIPNLDLKPYTVRIAKDGFLEAPTQAAEVHKGEETKLEFHLQPMPRVASLAIQGALAGTQILLDDNAIGTVQDDGSFTASSVSPGSHTLELRHESYKPKKIDKRFEAGATVQLASAEIAMEKLQAALKINVTPADARLTIARSGEAPRQVAAGLVNVADGSYTISGHAPNYSDRSVTVSVNPGETKPVDLVLGKVEPQSAAGMSDWDDPAGWVKENEWFIRKGGNFVGYKPAQTNGTFVFTADLRKGKRLQWVASWSSPQSFVLFQMDKKYLYRVQVSGGKETQLTKAPHPPVKQETYTIQMDVAPGNVVNRMYDGANWVVLDEWKEYGRNFGDGKFGFLLPGSDVIALSNFTFTPK
jgi:hypothetical protein